MVGGSRRRGGPLVKAAVVLLGSWALASFAFTILASHSSSPSSSSEEFATGVGFGTGAGGSRASSSGSSSGGNGRPYYETAAIAGISDLEGAGSMLRQLFVDPPALEFFVPQTASELTERSLSRRRLREKLPWTEDDALENTIDSSVAIAPSGERANSPEANTAAATTVARDPNGPGEMGKPVVLKDLNATEKEKEKLGWKQNAFNSYASALISVHRSLPDMRHAECRKQEFAADLPATSVIVCFHNEAWSVLLRTVHSILDRSPAHLVREIILVDDFSDMKHVKEPLERYMAAYPKVRIIRAERREGLIRARLLGARHATAPVLTFLDSHVECTKGWLEPLLDRIARSPTTVVCPVIDVIADDTLEYNGKESSDVNVGGFDWSLQFSWHTIPDRYKSGLLARRPSANVARI